MGLLLYRDIVRDPSSKVQATEIANGPNYTGMASLNSPFLLWCLTLVFGGKTTVSQHSAYRSIRHHWDP